MVNCSSFTANIMQTNTKHASGLNAVLECHSFLNLYTYMAHLSTNRLFRFSVQSPLRQMSVCVCVCVFPRKKKKKVGKKIKSVKPYEEPK